MHNPAWRPAQLHTGRLASIQHHFIEERPAVRSGGKPGVNHTLAVHMAVTAGHPADALQPQYLVDALTRQLNIPTSAIAGHHDWRVETITPEHSAANAGQGSRQRDLWGANYYPGRGPDGCLEFTALINIRPAQGKSQLVAGR